MFVSPTGADKQIAQQAGAQAYPIFHHKTEHEENAQKRRGTGVHFMHCVCDTICAMDYDKLCRYEVRKKQHLTLRVDATAMHRLDMIASHVGCKRTALAQELLEEAILDALKHFKIADPAEKQ